MGSVVKVFVTNSNHEIFRTFTCENGLGFLQSSNTKHSQDKKSDYNITPEESFHTMLYTVLSWSSRLEPGLEPNIFIFRKVHVSLREKNNYSDHNSVFVYSMMI